MIIDQLTPTASDNLTDEVPVEQGTSTFKTTWQKILDMFAVSGGTPAMDGTGSQGSANTLSRSDHVHPSDTSRLSVADFNTFEAKFVSFTVTLTVAGWNNKAQTISNSNFVATGYAYTVTPAEPSYLKYGEAQVRAGNVNTNGQMTFYCEDVPTDALTVNIQRVVSA